MLTTETQAGLLAAATAVGSVLRRTAPDAVKELAGLAYIISTVAPAHEELAEWQAAEGLPVVDREGYQQAISAASLNALAVLGTAEVQH